MQTQPKLLQFTALTWKDDAALYFPSGQTRFYGCNHVAQGNWGVNIRGEALAIPGTVNLPTQSSPPAPDQFQSAVAMVPAGKVFDGATPFATGDPNYKICTKITFPDTGRTFYVDAASYAANVITCNQSFNT